MHIIDVVKYNMPQPHVDVFDRAVQLAHKSTMTQRHGAVIVRNGEIIGEGYNHWTTYMSHSYSCHAEVAALLSVKNKTKKMLQDATMIVVRISNNHCMPNVLKLSKPCENCTKEINKWGIRKVFYSTNLESSSPSNTLE